MIYFVQNKKEMVSNLSAFLLEDNIMIKMPIGNSKKSRIDDLALVSGHVIGIPCHQLFTYRPLAMD